MVNIYVGNLPFTSSEAEISELFAQHGTVSKVQIVVDRYTGKSRGFGFVEMENTEEAQAAITALDGTVIEGRNLRVNEARTRTSRGTRGGDSGPKRW